MVNKNIFIALITFLVLIYPVNGLSSITLDLPINNSVETNDVLLLATTDDSNNVTVSFFYGSTLIGSNSSGNGTYSLTWDSTTVSDGVYSIKAEASNGTITLTSNLANITVDNNPTTNNPPTLCNVGDLDIREFDFEDKLKAGEDIIVDLEVENEGSDDLEDIEFKLILYDNDEKENVSTKTSKNFDLDEDESEQLQLTMSVPDRFDDNDDLTLYVFVYEEGNIANQCDSDSGDIEVERDDEDVRIEDFTISPNKLICGENFEVYVRLENFGTDEQDNLKLVVDSAELNLLQTEFLDLDAFDELNEDVNKRYTFLAPKNVKEGSYDLDVSVEYEDGGLADSSFGTISLENCKIDAKETEVSVIAFPQAVTEGKAFSIPIIVRNNEDQSIIYDVEISGDWVEISSKDSAKLRSGQEITLYVSGTVKDGIIGSANGVVAVKANGELVGTTPISVTIKEDKVFGDFVYPSTTILLGFGIAALIVIIVVISVLHYVGDKPRHRKIKSLDKKPVNKKVNSKKEDKPKTKDKKK